MVSVFRAIIIFVHSANVKPYVLGFDWLGEEGIGWFVTLLPMVLTSSTFAIALVFFHFNLIMMYRESLVSLRGHFIHSYIFKIYSTFTLLFNILKIFFSAKCHKNIFKT